MFAGCSHGGLLTFDRMSARKRMPVSPTQPLNVAVVAIISTVVVDITHSLWSAPQVIQMATGLFRRRRSHAAGGALATARLLAS